MFFSAGDLSLKKLINMTLELEINLMVIICYQRTEVKFRALTLKSSRGNKGLRGKIQKQHKQSTRRHVKTGWYMSCTGD